MTDAPTLDPNDVARRYLAAWNEKDAGRRRNLIGALWARDSTFIDPIMQGDGPDGMDACIAGVQARFPDFRFGLIEADGFGDNVRLSWGLGPAAAADAPVKGTDFLALKAGKLQAITGFFDQVPAPAAA